MKVQSMLKNDKKRQQNNIEAFIFQFEHISHVSSVYYVDFQHVRLCWEQLMGKF